MVGQQIDQVALERAEFDLSGVDCELARATVRQLLTDLNDVREVQFFGSGAVVTFNPLGVTREEIRTAIRQSGYCTPLEELPRTAEITRIRIRKKRKTTLRIL